MAIASISNMENDKLSTFTSSWLGFLCRSRARLEIHHISVSLSSLCNRFPEQLRLRFVRDYCNSPVKINGSRAFDRKSSMIILKPDRIVGSDSCQRIYVSTDSVSIQGDVAFMVCDNDDTLLSGSLIHLSNLEEKWVLVCKTAVSPLLRVHLAGQCSLGSVTLTESFYLNYLVGARQGSRRNHEVEGSESAPASGRMHQNGERRPVQVGGEDTGDGEDSEFALTGEHRRCGARQSSRRICEGGGSLSPDSSIPYFKEDWFLQCYQFPLPRVHFAGQCSVGSVTLTESFCQNFQVGGDDSDDEGSESAFSSCGARQECEDSESSSAIELRCGGARQASQRNRDVEGSESAPASGRRRRNGEHRPVQVGVEDTDDGRGSEYTFTGDGEDSEYALTSEHREHRRGGGREVEGSESASTREHRRGGDREGEGSESAPTSEHIRGGARQPSPSRRQASRRNHEGGGSNSASTSEPGRGGARQTRPRSRNRERKRPSELNPYAIFGLPIALALILGFILGVAVPKSSYQETNPATTTNYSLVAINMSNLFNSSNLFNMSNPVKISFPNGASREPRNPPDSATVNCWLRFQQSLWKAVWSTVGFGFRLIKFFFNQLSSVLKKLTPSADSATAESRPMFLMRLPQLLLNAGWSAASFGLDLFKFFCDQLSTKLKK